MRKPTAKPSSRKPWTVLVYLAGDNNLDGAGVTDLMEMKAVGSSETLNVVAQFDRAGTTDKTHRYYLRKGTTLAQDRVADLGETNTGDPKVLDAFLSWGIASYPADRTLVVLWNHGAGWDDTNIYKAVKRGLKRGVTYKRRHVAGAAPGARDIRLADVHRVGERLRRAVFATSIAKAASTRAILFDDSAQDFLDNLELKRVATKAKSALGDRIDVLGMDACLMSMAEVAYQLRSAVDVQVGSEELEPGDGWPYTAILRKLAAKPSMTARELGRTIVACYLASYGASAGVTQSALDLARADDLCRSIDGLARALIDGCAEPATLLAIVRARRSSQHYDTKEYVDLAHFCARLKAVDAGEAIGDECDIVQGAVAASVIASGAKGGAVANSHGLSIYFPETPASPLYAKLDFAKQGIWAAFLKAYRQALAG
jgi:hypothetical protein